MAGRTTAVLRVPSAIVPREANYVINPMHPDAARIVNLGSIRLDPPGIVLDIGEIYAGAA